MNPGTIDPSFHCGWCHHALRGHHANKQAPHQLTCPRKHHLVSVEDSRGRIDRARSSSEPSTSCMQAAYEADPTQAQQGPQQQTWVKG